MTHLETIRGINSIRMTDGEVISGNVAVIALINAMFDSNYDVSILYKARIGMNNK